MSAKDAASSAPTSRRLLLGPLALFLALAAFFLVRLFGDEPSKLPSALIGKPAPALTLPPLEGLVRRGEPVPGLAPGDLTAGAVSVVNVFASWCAPCRAEHPLLMDLASGGTQIIGINHKDDAENARRFLGQLGNPYAKVGTDRNGRAAIEWGVYGVPETFVVSGNGVIIFKHVGPLTPGVVNGPLKAAITRGVTASR